MSKRFLSLLFFFSETFMGEDCQNNKGEVNNKYYCSLYACKIWDQCLTLLINDPFFFILCRYDPEMDGRILLGKVDCTEEADLCRRFVPIDNSKPS